MIEEIRDNSIQLCKGAQIQLAISASKRCPKKPEYIHTTSQHMLEVTNE